MSAYKTPASSSKCWKKKNYMKTIWAVHRVNGSKAKLQCNCLENMSTKVPWMLIIFIIISAQSDFAIFMYILCGKLSILKGWEEKLKLKSRLLIIPCRIHYSWPELNGSGQEPRNRHFDWNFQVCQNPPKLREPTCVMWKYVPVLLFFLKAGGKDLTNRPEVLSSHSPPPPPPPPIAPFLLKNAEFGYTRYEKTRATRQKTVGWGGGEWRERTLGLFVKSFLPAFREKQHRNIFSHHTGRLAKFGWILTYLKISVEMAVTWFLPGAIQLRPWIMNTTRNNE